MTAGLVFLGGVGYTVTSPGTDRSDLSLVYAEPAVPPEPPTMLAVIGDSYSAPAENWGGANGWPAQVARANGAELTNLAVPASGYAATVSRDYDPPNFAVAATRVPDGVSAVVVFGGYNDRGSSPDYVAAGARATFATLRRLAPDAALIVIGPQWPNATPSPGVLAARDAIAAEAHTVGATWLDPIDGRWFADRPDLIGPDGVHPTQGPGQAFLASAIGPAVQNALSQ